MLYPTLDLEAEIVRAFRSRELYERCLRRDLLLDQTFVPDDPQRWPPVTFEALRADGGEILIDDFATSHRLRSEELRRRLDEWDGRGARPVLRPEDPMYRSILRTIVRDYLLERGASDTEGVRTRPEWVTHLKSPIAGRASSPLATSLLWKSIEHSVTSDELLIARRFLATVEATKQSLEREGALLPWEEALSRWQSSRPTVDSPWWGPCREVEFAYAQIYESFRVSVAPASQRRPWEALSPELQQHVARANAHLGLAQVTLEILPTLAFDMDAARWKQRGWAVACEESERMANRLRRFPDDWERLLAEEGEYWDPPAPTMGRPCQTSPSKLRNGKDSLWGPFGKLRRILGETDYTDFTTGHSVVTTVFENGLPGEIHGPYPGNLGVYLVKVIERTEPARPLDLEDPKHYEILVNSYVNGALLHYAHAALANADVRGRLEH